MFDGANHAVGHRPPGGAIEGNRTQVLDSRMQLELCVTGARDHRFAQRQHSAAETCTLVIGIHEQVHQRSVSDSEVPDRNVIHDGYPGCKLRSGLEPLAQLLPRANSLWGVELASEQLGGIGMPETPVVVVLDGRGVVRSCNTHLYCVHDPILTPGRVVVFTPCWRAQLAVPGGNDNARGRYGDAMAPDAISLMAEPNAQGRFGEYGGRFVPETLVPACEELEAAFREAWADPLFRGDLDHVLTHYAGRPSPLTECHRLSAHLGVRLLLKREDLNHTGSHKINNVLGQALLAQRMGKKRLVAETGAGQHGVASATAAALLGMECVVYMGEVDVQRQALNVFRMKLLGAEVRPVSSGSKTLKDAVNEAMRDWVGSVRSTHYCLGSVMGPHPYPWMVREFHRVIGTEAYAQCMTLLGDVPDVVAACVGGGSNAAGLFSGFVDTRSELVGAEPAGGAAVGRGIVGVVHGMRSYLMQDEHGQVAEAHSISAGLDYPGVGPEHSHLADIHRARYEPVTDAEVIDAFQLLSRMEGIIPALEPAHAIAWLVKSADKLQGKSVLINMSGRGDKDVNQMMDVLAQQ
jgi:tryptophan synthase beta chain